MVRWKIFMNFVEYDLENDVGSAFRDGYGGGF
jgi:hypothetical protein